MFVYNVYHRGGFLLLLLLCKVINLIYFSREGTGRGTAAHERSPSHSLRSKAKGKRKKAKGGSTFALCPLPFAFPEGAASPGNGAAQNAGEAIAPKTFTGNTPKRRNYSEAVTSRHLA